MWRAWPQASIITRINRQSDMSSLGVINSAATAYAAKPAPTLFEAERERHVFLYVLKP